MSCAKSTRLKNIERDLCICKSLCIHILSPATHRRPLGIDGHTEALKHVNHVRSDWCNAWPVDEQEEWDYKWQRTQSRETKQVPYPVQEFPACRCWRCDVILLSFPVQQRVCLWLFHIRRRSQCSLPHGLIIVANKLWKLFFNGDRFNPAPKPAQRFFGVSASPLRQKPNWRFWYL